MMKFYFVFFTLMLACCVQIQAQDKKNVKEVIIYEYDTVYVAPDTIKKIDTLFLNHPEVKKPKVSHWSVGIGLSFFAPELTRKFISVDSFYVQNKGYFSPDIYFIYSTTNSVISLKAGWVNLQEKLNYQAGFSVKSGSANYYDSIWVSKSCIIKNIYNYLTLSAGYEKIWTKKRFIYGFASYAGANLLISSKSIISASSINKVVCHITLGPFIGFKFKKNLCAQLHPFYQTSFNDKNKYPADMSSNLGLAARFDINL